MMRLFFPETFLRRKTVMSHLNQNVLCLKIAAANLHPLNKKNMPINEYVQQKVQKNTE